MTTEARWDTPEISVRTIRSMVLYFERHFGRERLERAWREQALPLPLSICDDLSNFVSYAFLERFLRFMTEASGDPDFVDHAGRSIATPEGLGFGYYLLRGVGSPELAYRKTIELGATYNRVGEFTVERSSPNELVLVYRSRVKENTRDACTGRRANFAAFPNIWGLPDAEVKELACQVKGDDCCRYHLRWQSRPPITWRRWAGAALAAVSLPFLGTTGLLAVVAGYFAGAWFDLRVLTRAADERVRENTAAMSRSLEELQQRADEIFRANVELDQRVADRTRELADALARLEKLDEAKSEFFANISHELRTPLTLILAPVEERLSHAASDDPATVALLQAVRRNAQRLLHFIDDLLDLSRIDAGHLRLSVAPVDLAALARTTVALFSGTAQARGIALSIEGPEHVADTWGDQHRLESVVSNLLGNAMKFTPAGGRVVVRVRDEADGVHVSVADTGPGIAADAQARIFERFFQVEGDGAQKKGGVGIGLALARNLVELHGGRLGVESELGHGATFTASFKRGRDHFRPEILERRAVNVAVPEGRRASDHATPVPVPASPVPAGPDAAPILFDGGRRPRVLVVEDNDELRALLSDLLAPSHDVASAADGAAGLAALRAHPPDLVLSDVMMPVMTGTELCAAIKSDSKLQTTPVILLTARSGADAALEGFAAGADEFLEKPFHPRVLLARVRAQLRLRALSLQLAGQARLAAVGTLAAGVGHEVRNPVNAVLNGARVLQKKELPADVKRLLDVVVDGATRIERISAALLDHVSPAEHGGVRPVDVAAGVEATLTLVGHRLHGVEIDRALGSNAKVLANAMELNQVLLNLVDNSLRAGAHHLWVRSQDADGRVRLSIEDDGPGIPPEVTPRLFDAFFTTRPPGEGTGLGLYLSRLAVERWGGKISFAPRAGGGAAFTLDLPRETAS